MKDQLQTYLLGFVALMTVVNTVLILTDDDGGRMIQPAGAAGLNPTSADQTVSTTLDRNNMDKAQDILNDPAKYSQPEPAPAGPTTSVQFAESAHSFGTIKQETQNEHVFSFTNTGGEPLIISNAKGSCGCTVPDYPKEPIPPGGSGEIKVVYSPGKQVGNQSKTVTVTANTEPSTTMLQISAVVEEI